MNSMTVSSRQSRTINSEQLLSSTFQHSMSVQELARLKEETTNSFCEMDTCLSVQTQSLNHTLDANTSLPLNTLAVLQEKHK